jgi:RNA polymerase sigma-70 factor (ECF subfamily)
MQQEAHSPEVARRKAQLQKWLEQARNGSNTALGHLLDDCRSYLLVVASDAIAMRLRAKLDPADLVQDTSLEAFRTFSAFEGELHEQLLAWLRRILLNNVADVSRRYEQTAMRRITREASLDLPKALDAIDSHPTPDELATMLEMQTILDRSLHQLPDHMRKVILLRQREYLSFAQIGEQMGRSAEAARKLWVRAIARLRREVQENWRDTTSES